MTPLHHRPGEVVVYFGDDILRYYQLRQWLPVFETLGSRHPVQIVTRDAETFDAVSAATALPCINLPSFGELTEFYRHADHKVAVYVNNSARNFQSLVARSMLHVHVNHGESDKICMVSNQVKAYDRVFVAGDAAINRHRAALIGFDHGALVPIGRPQLDLAPLPALPPTRRRTVLYAPTWEGEEPSNNYTSVDVLGPRIVGSGPRAARRPRRVQAAPSGSDEHDSRGGRGAPADRRAGADRRSWRPRRGARRGHHVRHPPRLPRMRL